MSAPPKKEKWGRPAYPAYRRQAQADIPVCQSAQRPRLDQQNPILEGVPKQVWEFHIGGYQVCEKWLKDRKKAGRKLSADDIEHYQKIVVALNETIRLMREIDDLIPGWPLP